MSSDREKVIIEDSVILVVKELKAKPAVILDVGSRDAYVSLAFRQCFPDADIYTFECYPPFIELCRQAIGEVDITLVEKAVSDVDGEVDFYGTDVDDNIGASSLFIVNPGFTRGRYTQDKMTVESITLLQWAADNDVDTIDVLWMGLQGAELKALVGLGSLLSTVQVIYTEVGYKEMYLGQALFKDIDRYLTSRGFYLSMSLHGSEWFGDALYVRRE